MKAAAPLRVMYFSHTAMLGGGEIALLNLIRTIDQTVICPIVVLASDGPLAMALRPIAQVHILELAGEVRQAKKDKLGIAALLKGGDLFRIAIYLRKLQRFISENKIDIVHANSLKGDILAGLSARLAGTPVIWHVRDRIENDYLPPLVVKAFRLLARLVPTFVVANSRATLKTLHLPEFSSGPGRFGVIHDGTTIPPWSPLRANEGFLQVGLIGRICPWKGQDIFIRAVAIVRKRFSNARFRIVGAALFGEKEYEEKIRARCRDLGLDDVMVFTGFLPDIPAVMRDLDVVVHASTIGEPFGQVIIEGMAAARPVVATNGGGVPEIVLNNITGLLVPMGDAAALANAICQLLESAELRSEMGRKGRERVQNHFTLQRVLAEIESVYSTIVRESRSEGQHNRELSNQTVSAR